MAEIYDISEEFIDTSSAETGKWEDYYNGIRLKIASTENPKYKAALSKGGQAHKVKLGGEPTPESVGIVKQITSQAMAEFILVDWENIYEKGAEVKYSKAKAFDLLMKSPRLFDFVQETADRDSRFHAEVVEEAKNS